jgi:hypothetical protein
MSRRVGSRALVLGSLAAGIAAGTAAVLSALGAPAASVSAADAAAPSAARSVAFGSQRVVVQPDRRGTRTCFRVQAARSCASQLTANEIRYVSTPTAVGGLAGANVRAVIVRLTRKGTVWATLNDGAFYAAVPYGYRARAVVKVLRDGTRKAFTVTASR